MAFGGEGRERGNTATAKRPATERMSPKNSSAGSASVEKARCGCVHRGVSQSQMAFGGEGRERGNTATAKRSVTEHPSGGADTFLGGGPIPLRRRV